MATSVGVDSTPPPSRSEGNVASGIQEDDIESPEEAKAARKSVKAQFTRTVTRIRKVISALGSRRELKILRVTLTELYEDCSRLHELYVRGSVLTAQEKKVAEEWARNLAEDAKQCYEEIEGYFDSRRDDASSISVSASSQVSVLSVVSDRLKDIEQDKQKTALRLQQQRRGALEELEQNRKIKEQELALEEQKQKAKFERQQRETKDLLERQELEANALRQEVALLGGENNRGVEGNVSSTGGQGAVGYTTSALSTVPTIGVVSSEVPRLGKALPELYSAWQPRAQEKEPTRSYSETPFRPQTDLRPAGSSLRNLFPDVGTRPKVKFGNDANGQGVTTIGSYAGTLETKNTMGLHATSATGAASFPLTSHLRSYPYNSISTDVGPTQTCPSGPSIHSSNLQAPVSGVPSWIDDPQEFSTSARNQYGSQCLGMKLPPLQITPFSGDPKDWPMFKSLFKSLVHDVLPSDAQKIAVLRELLDPSIRNSIAQSLHSPVLYHQALRELEQKYGHPHLIVRAYVQNLLQLPHVRENDFESLKRFGLELRGAVATLKHSGYGHLLQSDATLDQVVAKLPGSLRSRWGRKMLSFGTAFPSLIDLDEWLDVQIMGEMRVMPLNPPTKSKDPKQQGKVPKGTRNEKSKLDGTRHPTVLKTSSKEDADATCAKCDAPHDTANCKEFVSLGPQERFDLIRVKKRCFRCFSAGHVGAKCSRDTPCGKDGCKRRHHPLIHGVNPVPYKQHSNGEGASPQAKPLVGTAAVKSGEHVMLSVVPVALHFNGRKVSTYALLDTGSEVSLLRTDIARKLGLAGKATTVSLSTFHGQDPRLNVEEVNFNVSSEDGSVSFEVTGAFAVRNLNLAQRSMDWPKEKHRWSHLKDLELPAIKPESVSVLLGMDVLDAHQVLEDRKPLPGCKGPRAIRTPFGWCVVGRVPGVSNEGHRVMRIAKLNSLEDLVQSFWRVEALGVHRSGPLLNPDDERATQVLKRTTRHLGDRYEVGLLWRSEDFRFLSDNKGQAIRRLLSLEKKFNANPNFAERYSAVIREYLELGHAVRVEEPNVGESRRTWYLPHHGVTQAHKPEKVRVVFDAAARDKGVSLNDALLKGPDLLTSLIGVLIRFREEPIPLSADIEKMYHQVRVPPSDRNALRFVWRFPGSPVIETYQMAVHIFGAVSSPSTCIYILQRTASDNAEEFADVAHKVIENFYVDNFLDSVESEKTARSVLERLTNLLSRGGFHLTKWSSSTRAVIATVPPSERADSHLNLDLDKLPVERTLGVLWNKETDEFQLTVKVPVEAATKRQILRAVASIYDPLGMLAPIVIAAKVLLQDLWRSDIGWDDEVPPPIMERWRRWTEGLVGLASVTIPRCLRKTASKPKRYELHVFSDASEVAYGAVAFLRTVYADASVYVSFVMAKLRVAPLAPLTIPRLELLGALMAARLGSTVVQAFRFQLSCVTYWTDSQTVLQWINSRRCRFHTFVANRVGEILELTAREQWRHVPGELNPADDGSRGLKGTEFGQNRRWLFGPDFLLEPDREWPATRIAKDCQVDDPEIREEKWAGVVTECVPNVVLALVKSTSRLLRLKRTVAWIIRFLLNCRTSKDKRTTGPLQVNELDQAMTICCRLVQQEAFPDECVELPQKRSIPAHSRLLKLSPVVGTDGLLRVGGRLDRGDFPYDVKHPVILPPEGELTAAVIRDFHERTMHGSVDRTLCEMRQQFWPLKGRATVRRVLNRCFVCKQLRSKPSNPLMAALPLHRMQHNLPPFSNTGIDYFGPLTVVIQRRTEKRYGCIFTCLVTRAVHLELAHSLDTDSFLMCFRRFVGRRGMPSVCYSDNGTNLTSGERELNEGIQRWNQQKIADAMTQKGVTWHFSPPSAPHFGGVWERLIQSAKIALRAVLKNRTVTDEILRTLLVEVEALLNGRPLTHVPVDPLEPEPLTPNHFLIGRATVNLPPDVIVEEGASLRKKWRTSQVIVDHFWKRWVKEYLPNLIERRKWLVPRRNLKRGDVVLVVDPTSPRGHWPVGQIENVFPGPDGTVRTAEIRTKTGIFVRPTSKLCLLETEEDEEDTGRQ